MKIKKNKNAKIRLFTFHSNMAIRFLLTGLEVGRWLEIVDTHNGRSWLVLYHLRRCPVFLEADLCALPVNIVYRGAATYFQLASGEMLVRNEKLKADLGNLPLGLVRVQRTVRADMRLQRLCDNSPRLNRWNVLHENSLAPRGFLDGGESIETWWIDLKDGYGGD